MADKMTQHDLCERILLMFKSMSFATAMLVLLASAVTARAADITGVPKIQTADQISINTLQHRAVIGCV